MTSDEIQKMPDRELDAVVAEQVMGWERWITMVVGSGAEKWGHPPGSDLATAVPDFSQSLDDCHEAEERLAEMGLATAFTVQLYLVAVEAQKADGRRHPIRWYEVHATASQRAEAILLAAMQGKEGG